jgi:hypothetical protein
MVHIVIVIICIMLSVSLCPKVITLRGFHFTLPFSFILGFHFTSPFSFIYFIYSDLIFTLSFQVDRACNNLVSHQKDISRTTMKTVKTERQSKCSKKFVRKVS